MGNFEKLGVLVIIILAVVIVIVLIGDGPDGGLEPVKGKAPSSLVGAEERSAGGNGLSPEPDDPPWPIPPLPPVPDPDPVPEPEPVPEDLDHTIRKGDTPYSLAKLYYGKGKYFKEILDANPGLDPNAIPLGKVIRIPHPSKVLGESAEHPQVPPASSDEIYVVQRGDNLWKIAAKLFGSGSAHRRILQANLDVLGADGGSRLSPGMRLKIPR